MAVDRRLKFVCETEIPFQVSLLFLRIRSGSPAVGHPWPGGEREPRREEEGYADRSGIPPGLLGARLFSEERAEILLSGSPDECVARG